MYATMPHDNFPFGEHFRSAMDILSSLFAKQNLQEPVGKVSTTKFVASRQPLSPEILQTVERLELAIRQGSVNA